MCFFKDLEEQVENLKYILKIFETIFGLRVNFLKSSLVDIGVSKQDLDGYTNFLGCRVEEWPLKYLGLPLWGRPKSVFFWDPVVERVHMKLSCWKRSYISLGGRSTLIKVALANLPVYSIFVQDALKGG